MTTKIIEVIYTTELVGKGVSGDPMRRNTQLWSKEGNLILEYDSENKEEAIINVNNIELYE